MNVFRRHNPAKCKYTSRFEYRCKCPIWVDGYRDGRRIRQPLKLRDWNRAQEIVRRWEVDGEKPTKKAQVTIEEWRDQFLQDATTSRHLSDGTLRLYKLLFRQLISFARDRGISLANNIDLDALTKFRATWKLEPLTALKTLERLRSIYKFAVKRKMVGENYALDLVPPEVEENPTLPFPEEEMLRIIKASVSDKADRRINAFILTMRYSGLRISDVSALSTDSLEGNRLRLYQTKTGVFVSVLIPPDVAEVLRAVPHKNPKYFFWSGTSKVSSITGSWRKRLAVVFKLAGIKNGWDQEWPQSQIP